ncbi:MAG: hypothetical protein M3305_18425 [Actinomycetota bacterium]|nr:hypothetical protein [Actinomycetota bacterium]
MNQDHRQNESDGRVKLDLWDRSNKIIFAVLALVVLVTMVGIAFLAITGGSEYIKFALAMIMFVTLLGGSYWWVVFGQGRWM